MRLEPDVVAQVAARQAGVVTTAQLAALGADRSWTARQVTGGHWQRLHPGVLVTHSGPVLWRARAWGAVLHAGSGAALSHAAAAHVAGFRAEPPSTIDVSIPARRRVVVPPGLRVHRRRTMPPTVGRPPRTWAEDTVLDLVRAARSEDDALGAVCDAVRSVVPVLAVRDAVARRGGWSRWRLLEELLGEVEAGVESPLERRYRRDVERAHGLPVARLQQRDVVDGLWIRADCVYEGLGLRVELDGALAHPGGRTDADTWRDNAVLVARAERTLRYRWSHVATAPCPTARQVLAGLRRADRSIDGRRCGAGCTVA